ncbi:DUF3459 domain-containing protein, partial [Bifidobacterium pseudocatenulatum]|uniref:DUF3459 domain-containing protein n=1 Tax=Bifidobacterium pseudocatenulatum TaxID=28026 RepID=UPI001CF9E6A5
SVYGFYKKLIAMRHNMPIIAVGDFSPMDAGNDDVIAFQRHLEDTTIMVICNLSSKKATISESLRINDNKQQVLLSNYSTAHAFKSMHDGVLDPWEAITVQL